MTIWIPQRGTWPLWPPPSPTTSCCYRLSALLCSNLCPRVCVCCLVSGIVGAYGNGSRFMNWHKYCMPSWYARSRCVYIWKRLHGVRFYSLQLCVLTTRTRVLVSTSRNHTRERARTPLKWHRSSRWCDGASFNAHGYWHTLRDLCLFFGDIRRRICGHVSVGPSSDWWTSYFIRTWRNDTKFSGIDYTESSYTKVYVWWRSEPPN